jgi:alanyl-tRNA synthetase
MERAEGRGARGLVGLGRGGDEAIWFEIKREHGATEFLGYDTETAEGVSGAGRRRRARSTSRTGAEVAIVVNQTPFYGESGGQVGDRAHPRARRPIDREVTDTQKRAEACSCT